MTCTEWHWIAHVQVDPGAEQLLAIMLARHPAQRPTMQQASPARGLRGGVGSWLQSCTLAMLCWLRCCCHLSACWLARSCFSLVRTRVPSLVPHPCHHTLPAVYRSSLLSRS